MLKNEVEKLLQEERLKTLQEVMDTLHRIPSADGYHARQKVQTIIDAEEEKQAMMDNDIIRYWYPDMPLPEEDDVERAWMVRSYRPIAANEPGGSMEIVFCEIEPSSFHSATTGPILYRLRSDRVGSK